MTRTQVVEHIDSDLLPVAAPAADSSPESCVCPDHTHRAPTWLQRRIHGAIVVYQRIRDGRPSPCRFFPSCSAYALEAVDMHGAWRGGWMSVRRLVRCRPLGPSGFDPVPAAPVPAAPCPTSNCTCAPAGSLTSKQQKGG